MNELIRDTYNVTSQEKSGYHHIKHDK